MNLIERAKNILLAPQQEWPVIANEEASLQSVLMGYVVPMSVVSAIGPILSAVLVGGIIAGGTGMTFGLGMALVGLLTGIIGYIVAVFVVDALAPSFGSEKNMGRSAQLVGYSATPSYVAGLLSFIPVIGGLLSLAAWVYSVYLIYLGLQPMKQTPEDKKVIYLVVVFLVMLALNFILAAVLAGIILKALGVSLLSAAGMFG